MVVHLPSTLNDDGIDDDDMRNMEPPKLRPQTGDSFSHGSVAQTSSLWDFRVEDEELHDFSSAQRNVRQLPETVPIPSQLELVRDRAVKSGQKHDYLDFSETCSTSNRSTACNDDAGVDEIFDFSIQESDLPDFAAAEAAEVADSVSAEQAAELSNDTPSPSRNNSKQANRKPYNTRSRPKISYADAESSYNENNDSNGVAYEEPAPRAVVKKPTKKPSPAKKNSPTRAKGTSPKGKQQGGRVDGESPQTAERKKKRQRRKTPLPLDEVTLIVVPSTLPATPPVSIERSKKHQKLRKRQKERPPAAPKPKARTANPVLENASPAPIPYATSSELGSRQPAEVSSDAVSEDLHLLSNSPAPAVSVVQDDEEQDGSSGAESTHSTEMTTPSAVPSNRRISSVQVPVLSYPSLPLPPSPPLIYEEVRDSVESIPATRPSLMRDLSTLMSGNVSRRDDDIGHRLQDVNKRVLLYVQDKEKDVASVASTYLKNGTRCVDRLQNRFEQEHRVLLERLHEEKYTFLETLSTAKRDLREAAKQRQQILKELGRNAKKRQQASSNEANRIMDLAKRIMNED